MEKANEDIKNRTGIYVQVSAGVATAGEGLASKEAKSPVTKVSSAERKKNADKKKRKGESTSASRKTVKCKTGSRRTTTNPNPATLVAPTSGSTAVSYSTTDTPSTNVANSTGPEGDAMTEKRTVSYESTLSQSKPVQNTLFTPLPDGSKAVSYSHASAEEHSNRIATPNVEIVNSVGPEGAVLTSKTSVSYSLTSGQGRPLPDPKSAEIPSGSVAVSYSSSAGEESKRASRNDIRNAKGIYRALSLIPIAERSPEQSSKLEWAKAILRKRLTSSDLTSKRQRSVEDSVSESKRQKVHNSSTHTRKDLSFSDVLKDKSILAVIDRSNVDGMISFDRWTMVSNKLQISYWTLMMENPGEPAVVEDAGWYQGRVKLVAFGDKRSCDLYKLAISRLEGLWPDAKLEVVAKEDIPCRPRARISIPAELACKDTVLKMIQFGNPSLPTHDWKVAKLEEPTGPYRSAIIVINKESLTPLAANQSQIRFGWTSTTLRIYKKDEESAKAAPPALPAPEVPSLEKDTALNINPPSMEVDTPVVSPTEEVPSGSKTPAIMAPISDSSDVEMETEDYLNRILLSEDELLRSSSESESEEDLDLTVVGADLANSSIHAPVSSD